MSHKYSAGKFGVGLRPQDSCSVGSPGYRCPGWMVHVQNLLPCQAPAAEAASDALGEIGSVQLGSQRGSHEWLSRASCPLD